ncbi:uncharacterized protein K460DRAFT_378492 [Cucurbitaria berberidis CBS 394.84]|uniref:4'-phosphopantetheinyl transferase domain-containing protein n=1 Tax=Cucurbitaria berberidis CBS 394.84 TaxID=1168544 RepID=A0A9P4L623_9PLEO|nr:uncharacterized protein K460DRAFT_378492 [Cucurbitaria berberidis CBS 394.84]KAF1843320.1 hypothetical protein K460DRAFT_378492 [Cucurbitaria berberidis CBS 394.84]
MPPRPFPFPLRVGTDICNIARLRAIITRRSDGEPLRPLSQFISRVLSGPERTYFWARFGPPAQVLGRIDTVSEFLAGRFAAKEACRKACNHLDPNTRAYHQILILPIKLPGRGEKQSSPPQGLILDKAIENIYKDDGEQRTSEGELTTSIGGTLMRKIEEKRQIDAHELEGQLCEISISHDGDFATAVAIVPSMDTQKEEHVPS